MGQSFSANSAQNHGCVGNTSAGAAGLINDPVKDQEVLEMCVHPGQRLFSERLNFRFNPNKLFSPASQPERSNLVKSSSCPISFIIKCFIK